MLLLLLVMVELFPHPSYSPDLLLRGYHQQMLQGFSSETKDKSLYTHRDCLKYNFAKNMLI